MLARRTDARARVGPRGKSRGQLYTPVPLLRPLLPCRCDGRADARVGRVLWRALPRLLDEGVSRPTGVDRPYKGAPPRRALRIHLILILL